MDDFQKYFLYIVQKNEKSLERSKKWSVEHYEIYL